MGTRMACLAVLHAWYGAAIGAMVGQLARKAIRGEKQQGYCYDCDEAKGGVSLRSGVESGSIA